MRPNSDFLWRPRPRPLWLSLPLPDWYDGRVCPRELSPVKTSIAAFASSEAVAGPGSRMDGAAVTVESMMLSEAPWVVFRALEEVVAPPHFSRISKSTLKSWRPDHAAPSAGESLSFGRSSSEFTSMGLEHEGHMIISISCASYLCATAPLFHRESVGSTVH